MEPIAHDPGSVHIGRQGKHLRHLRLRAVKGGVEAGDLGQFGARSSARRMGARL